MKISISKGLELFAFSLNASLNLFFIAVFSRLYSMSWRNIIQWRLLKKTDWMISLLSLQILLTLYYLILNLKNNAKTYLLLLSVVHLVLTGMFMDWVYNCHRLEKDYKKMNWCYDKASPLFTLLLFSNIIQLFLNVVYEVRDRILSPKNGSFTQN